jgi:PAS domain S-box-containing protein
MASEDREDLLERLHEVEERLEDAEETLSALRTGQVDAIVVSHPAGERVYTLKGADEAYRILIQEMSEGALTVTPEGLILYSNQQFAALVHAPLERVMGANFHDFVVPEHRLSAAALVENGLQSPTKGEVRLKALDGTDVPVYLSASHIAVDSLDRLCLMLTDLSEQKRNEQVVAAGKLANSILQQAAEAVLVLASDGRIVRASRATHELAGDGVLLRRFDEVFHLSFRSTQCSLQNVLSILRRGDAVKGIETTAVLPDGRVLELILGAAPLVEEDGERLGYVVTLTDITRRKHAEDELAAARNRLQQVLSTMAEGHCILDSEWRVVEMNAAAERQYGRCAGELTGKNLWREVGSGPGSVFYDRFHEAAAAGVPIEFEAESEMKPGFWLDMHVYPHQGGLEIYFHDITARKRAEQTLLQAQKLESVGLLAAGVAHDFNNLLVSIMGYASLLRDEASDDTRERLDAIIEASGRAADLTRQLLAYAGKGQLAIRPVDLSKLVHQLAALLLTSIPKKVHLREDLDRHLPPVVADSGQVQQIIMNLVLNAADAIPEEQSGTIVIRTSAVEVTASDAIPDEISHASVRPGRYVCLEVRDTGSGMDRETRTKIFDPFFTTKFLGRGLGLPAAVGVVKAHRGAIQVTSALGKGSAFRIFLPAAEDRARAARAPETEDLSGFGMLLVVDDEEIVRRVARAALERFGYKVLTAADGRDAIQICEKHGESIRGVLLDLAMPVMSGGEALEILTRKWPGVKVMLMSGYGETEATRLFAGKGVTSFIQKPFTAARLAGLVKSAFTEQG